MDDGYAYISVAVAVFRSSAGIGLFFSARAAKFVRAATVVTDLYTVKPLDFVKRILFFLEIHYCTPYYYVRNEQKMRTFRCLCLYYNQFRQNYQ